MVLGGGSASIAVRSGLGLVLSPWADGLVSATGTDFVATNNKVLSRDFCLKFHFNYYNNLLFHRTLL